MDNFYTAQEVADILKIKKTTVYDLVKKKRLPATKVGKQIRISKEDFDAYLAHFTESPVPKNGEQKEEKIQESTGKNLYGAMDGQIIESVSVDDAYDNVFRSREFLRNNTGLLLSGDDEVITAFYAYYRLQEDSLPVIKQWQNVYDSLYSLYFGKVHAAFIMIPEEDEASLYRMMLPGMSIVSVHVAETEFGIYLSGKWKGRISSLEDIAREGCRLAVSDKGSVSRILFDSYVKEHGIDRKSFSYAKKESMSTLQAALMIENGEAEAALGDASIRNQFPELMFIPIKKLSLKLVFNKKYYSFPAFPAMVNVLSSENFRRRLNSMGGYQAESSGSIKVF